MQYRDFYILKMYQSRHPGLLDGMTVQDFNKFIKPSYAKEVGYHVGNDYDDRCSGSLCRTGN